jgi:hypothetical protein
LKEKLPLSHAMMTYKGSRGKAPLILNPSIHWMEGRVVSKAGVDFCSCPDWNSGTPTSNACGISGSQCDLPANSIVVFLIWTARLGELILLLQY